MVDSIVANAVVKSIRCGSSLPTEGGMKELVEAIDADPAARAFLTAQVQALTRAFSHHFADSQKGISTAATQFMLSKRSAAHDCVQALKADASLGISS